MKKILLILSLLFSSLFADLDWESYDDALRLAEKENKLVMVMLSREGCPACEYMIDVVFEQENATKEVYEKFIPVQLDIHKDFIPSGLTYIGTPTFHFINSHEAKVERIDGGVNAKEFLDIINSIK